MKIKGDFIFYTTKIFPSNPERAERKSITDQTIEYLHKVIEIELKREPNFFENAVLETLTEENSKPDFLEKITFLKNSELKFTFNEGITSRSPLEDGELLKAALIEAVEDKEQRLEVYIEDTGTTHQWLLIVNEGVSSESYDTESLEVIPDIETGFEKVFLLTDFINQVITIK